MSRTSVLARGRIAALAGMTDTCTITRVTAASVDKVTGVTVATATAAVYSGTCKVQGPNPASATPATPGEAYQLQLPLELHIPATVTGVEPGDLVTITASVHDADLVARTFRVRELAHKSHATAHRLGIEETTS